MDQGDEAYMTGVWTELHLIIAMGLVLLPSSFLLLQYTQWDCYIFMTRQGRSCRLVRYRFQMGLMDNWFVLYNVALVHRWGGIFAPPCLASGPSTPRRTAATYAFHSVSGKWLLVVRPQNSKSLAECPKVWLCRLHRHRSVACVNSRGTRCKQQSRAMS